MAHCIPRKLGSSQAITLAETNCTDVTAVRAMWSEISDYDFGLCCFFILSGALYYRQLIKSEWTDAVPISYGPEGVNWAEVHASRTWDYRVILQMKSSTGEIYELITQFMAIGKQNSEYVELRSISPQSEMTEIHYSDFKNEDERVELSIVMPGALYGGLYSIDVPRITDAYNLADENADYGKNAVFVFDVHLVAAEVSAQHSAFTIVDANNTVYTASTATLGADGKTVTLTFADFNNAAGTCQAKYTAGTVTTMAGTSMATVAKSFTPTGLVPTAIPAPQVMEVTNI